MLKLNKKYKVNKLWLGFNQRFNNLCLRAAQNEEQRKNINNRGESNKYPFINSDKYPFIHFEDTELLVEPFERSCDYYAKIDYYEKKKILLLPTVGKVGQTSFYPVGQASFSSE